MLNGEIIYPMAHHVQPGLTEQFHTLAEFPSVFTIYRTLIPILAPSHDEHLYLCIKGYHALNIQDNVERHGQLLNIDAEWSGAAHDALI